MSDFPLVIAVVGVLAVVVVLAMGVRQMASASHDDAESERLMFFRIAMQAGAIIAVMAAVFLLS